MPHNNLNAPDPRPDVLSRPKLEGGRRFVLATPFQPAGDQPRAIAELTRGIDAGERDKFCWAQRVRVRPLRWPN